MEGNLRRGLGQLNVVLPFLSLMMMTMNILPFNAICSFEKTRKSNSTKLGDYGCCGIIFFIARNSHTEKAE
jgi:hypothetical protein